MNKLYLWAASLVGCGALVIGIYYAMAYSELTEIESQIEMEAKPTDGEGGAKWRLLAWADGNGDIPSNPLPDAIDELEEYLENEADPEGLSNGGIRRLNFRSMGPKNAGGRTRSLLINPGDSNILYAGSVTGGVFKSEDRGASWFALNHPELSNLGVASMALDPTDPNTIYAGTGEFFRGGGLFKSADGGLSWELVPDTEDFGGISRVSVAPDHTILLATSGGIRRKPDSSSEWTLVYPPALSQFRVCDSRFVAFDPYDSDNAIAEVLVQNGTGVVCTPGPKLRRVIYSTDSGVNWAPSQLPDGDSTVDFDVPDERSRVELAYFKRDDPMDPNVVYGLYPRPTGSPATLVDQIVRSNNGGANFEFKSTQPIPTASPSPYAGIYPSGYNNTLWVSPTNENFIIAGGTLLFKSTDAGDSFIRISEGGIIDPYEDPHPDQHCIVPDAGFGVNNNKTVYVCNDGGVFRTDDITAVSPRNGWKDLNNNYRTTQFYAAAGRASDGFLIGGTQDNGTLRVTSSSPEASVVIHGDGGAAAVDSRSHSQYCYSTLVPPFPLATGPPSIMGSSNNGATHTPMNQGVSGPTNWITPLILDPNNQDRLLAGTWKLWRNDHAPLFGSSTWIPIYKDGTEGEKISAIAVAPGASNIMWFASGFPNSKVYKTTDGTNASPSPSPSWTPIDDNSSGSDPFPRWVTRILIDKDNSEVAYVSMGGFDENDNIQRTTDGGSTWNTISSDLPQIPIRGIARHPALASTLYVGTEMGIYETQDTGAHWKPIVRGPSRVSVDELFFLSGSTKLVAATYGRGIWMADVECNRLTTSYHAPNDFDGDGLTDIAVVRPTPSPGGTPLPSTWHTMQSCRDYNTFELGLRGDQIAPGDFDGDGKTDRAVFREDSNIWYWVASSDPGPTPTPRTLYYGTTGDIAVPADYDGDNIDDFAVWRPADGYWYIRQSSDDQDIYVQWGEDGDVPAPADYDGDGNDDQAVFRLKNGIWWLNIEARTISFQFGLEGDVPVAGYYDDDDAKADIAVWRPSEGRWYIAFAVENYETFKAVSWGLEDDVAVPGDYDGDGRTDIAVWRPSDGNWYILESTNGFNAVHFGSEGDIPTNGKTVDAINNRPGAAQNAETKIPSWARPQRQPPAYAR